MPAAHPSEFRARAVELARLREQPIAKIAKDLGVSESCLRRWMDLADVDGGVKPGLSSDERKELVGLIVARSAPSASVGVLPAMVMSSSTLALGKFRVCGDPRWNEAPDPSSATRFLTWRSEPK